MQQLQNGPDQIHAVTKPIGFDAFLVGILSATAVAGALQVLDAMGRGDPNGGFLLIAVVLGSPVLCVLYSLIGCLPFLALRKMTPRSALVRLGFILLVLTPVVLAVCRAAEIWLTGLWDYSPYFPSPKPPFFERLHTAATQQWRAMLFVGFWAALACWGVDQKSRLFSDLATLRRKARLTLAAGIAVIVVPIALFFTCDQYIVIYRAQEIAGDRPYCILVPTPYKLYATATQLWQLSAVRMRALYQLTTGSRGGYYVTNHALLVLDNPREYLNWSYRAENFVFDPLINITHGFDRNGEPLAVMQFRPCVPERDFVATLK